MYVLLGLLLHWIRHIISLPMCTTAHQHQGREEDIEIVLGLEAEPHQGTTHYWGLPYQLVTPGAHSNKQTNKPWNFFKYRIQVCNPRVQGKCILRIVP